MKATLIFEHKDQIQSIETNLSFLPPKGTEFDISGLWNFTMNPCEDWVWHVYSSEMSVSGDAEPGGEVFVEIIVRLQ